MYRNQLSYHLSLSGPWHQKIPGQRSTLQKGSWAIPKTTTGDVRGETQVSFHLTILHVRFVAVPVGAASRKRYTRMTTRNLATAFREDLDYVSSEYGEDQASPGHFFASLCFTSAKTSSEIRDEGCPPVETGVCRHASDKSLTQRDMATIDCQ